MRRVLEGKKYHIETMGCQMNERDSETIAGLLEELGARSVSAAGADLKSAGNEADLIFVNTCSVRENADNRFFGILGQLKKVKETRPETLVGVCGCMMQQQTVVDRVRGKFGWVDLVFGTHNIHTLPELISNAIEENDKIVSVWKEAEKIVEGLPSKRAFPFKAYVNIMYGCDNYCTYCIVPYTRGRERSRGPADVEAEVRRLAEDGVKEIMLLGQNVNSYRGEDEGGLCMDFPSLIRRLDAVKGIERIRFMTSHPKDFSEGLINVYLECPSLCPALHLPIQSGSSRILKRMNRRYTKEGYLSLIVGLRNKLPDLTLTTDFIVGFPGETDEDFEDTMDVIEKVRFDSAFTFLFSPRQGTPAADYGDQVPEEIKHERFNRMVRRLNEITLENNLARVGRVEQVLIEGRSKTNPKALTGRTPGGRLVNIPGNEGIEGIIGQITDVRLTGAATFSFLGELV